MRSFDKTMIMKKTIFIFLFVCFLGSTYAQSDTKNVWKTLGKISYKREMDELLGFKVEVPVFHPSVKELEGKEITVKGYVIPVEGYEDHSDFIFSAFPYNMCFFCGGAGPETVMEVKSLEPIKFTAKQIVIRGKLVLNEKDINRLMYQLVDVRKVSE